MELERQHDIAMIAEIQARLAELNRQSHVSSRSPQPQTDTSPRSFRPPTKPAHNRLSPEARKRIADAQKKRWAAARRAQKQAAAVPPKHRKSKRNNEPPPQTESPSTE
jgi:hypothetical protein